MGESLDVLVLCGGLGTRFRPVSDHIPKVLAPVAGRPMLDRVLSQIVTPSTARVVLAAGFRADAIRQHYAEQIARGTVVVSAESEPRGTAGAIKAAEHLLTSDSFLVANGDSICALSLDAFRAFHAIRSDARVSIALADADARTDTGLVTIDARGAVTAYGGQAAGLRVYMSTGVYLFRREVLASIAPDTFVSLEQEVLPRLVGHGLYGFAGARDLIDIGTPERFCAAQESFLHTTTTL